MNLANFFILIKYDYECCHKDPKFSLNEVFEGHLDPLFFKGFVMFIKKIYIKPLLKFLWTIFVLAFKYFRALYIIQNIVFLILSN